MIAAALSAAFLAAAPTISATPLRGLTPLSVTLSAPEGYSSYHWDFGDGAQLDGRVVSHSYAAGAWTATLTADGETASVLVRAYSIGWNGPDRARFGRTIVFSGSTSPALPDAPVRLTLRGAPAGKATTRADGTFSVRTRALLAGPWSVDVDGINAGSGAVRLLPKLTTAVSGTALLARVRPSAAGGLRVQAYRGSRLVLDRVYPSRARVALTRGSYRIRVSVVPADGYGGAVHVVRALLGYQRLRVGSAGAVVRQLTARLRELDYAAPATSAFDGRVLDAVYAFQKVQGLPRTGSVDPAFWRRLDAPRLPSPRYRTPASHLEVAKARQVLFVVRGGRIALIVPVSTAGLPGKFTPVGRFAIYRKVGGFDPSPLGTLFDPMYFTGGYAIHGNPSVPPYPASHGCVRVPMWVAHRLYTTNPYGETVYVY